MTHHTKSYQTWTAFEQALREFQRKHGVDWTSRELQDNTARDIAERAFEIDAAWKEWDEDELLLPESNDDVPEGE